MPKGGGGLTRSKISVIRNCLFFFGSGGGLSQSKISLSEKTEFFVGFFLPKGGGSHLFQEGFYHKILIFVIKYSVFSSNTQFFFNFSKYFFFDIKKILFYFGVYPKGGGGGLAQSKISVNRKRLKFFWINFVTEGGGPARSKISVNRKN